MLFLCLALSVRTNDELLLLLLLRANWLLRNSALRVLFGKGSRKKILFLVVRQLPFSGILLLL